MYSSLHLSALPKLISGQMLTIRYPHSAIEAEMKIIGKDVEEPMYDFLAALAGDSDAEFEEVSCVWVTIQFHVVCL